MAGHIRVAEQSVLGLRSGLEPGETALIPKCYNTLVAAPIAKPFKQPSSSNPYRFPRHPLQPRRFQDSAYIFPS